MRFQTHGQGVIITWSGGYYHMVRGLLSHGQGVIINHLYCLLDCATHHHHQHRVPSGREGSHARSVALHHHHRVMSGREGGHSQGARSVALHPNKCLVLCHTYDPVICRPPQPLDYDDWFYPPKPSLCIILCHSIQ